MRRQSAAPAVLLAAALASAACGSSPAPAGPSAGQPDKVAAGVIAIVDVAPIYLGKQKSFFSQRGIDLSLSTSQGGAAIVHAQRADRQGNVQLWGLTGVQKEAVLAARRSLVTVEEVVEALDPRPGAVVLPSWVVTLVSVVPGGARPSYAQGYYDRDNRYYRDWDAISRDRSRFGSWLREIA